MTNSDYSKKAKATRRQAALERRQDDYRRDDGYANLYNKEAGK